MPALQRNRPAAQIRARAARINGDVMSARQIARCPRISSALTAAPPHRDICRGTSAVASIAICHQADLIREHVLPLRQSFAVTSRNDLSHGESPLHRGDAEYAEENAEKERIGAFSALFLRVSASPR